MIQNRKFAASEASKTINRAGNKSQRQAAVVVGVGLVLMSITAMFAATVQGNLFVPDNPVATAQNILANELTFRLAILSFFVVVVLDVIVAWGLYVFFKPISENLSLLAAWFRLVYSAIFAVAIMELGNALRIYHSADALTALGADQLQEQALLALNAFSDGWDIALAIFGLHLILIGYLVLKPGTMPKLLGALVLICGLGYVFDAVGGFLFPNFGVTVSQITFIGEMLLGLWLLVKGVSNKQWQKFTLKTT